MLRRCFDWWAGNFRVRLVAGTIAGIMLAVALYSGLLFLHEARVSEQQQVARAERLADLLAESLAHPLYEFNEVAILASVQALRTHAEIRAVRVLDSNGKVMAEHGSSTPGDALLLSVTREIHYDAPRRRLQVGRMELAFARSALDAEITDSMLELMIGGLLMTLTTMAFVLWTFRSALRPLNQITTGLNQLAAGNAELDLPPEGRRDEFGAMITAMHRFRAALIERERAREEMARVEQRYREELEATVAQRTAQLAEAKSAAEAGSRAKSVFLANMSHEIRTPLNAVLGLARIIVRESHGRSAGKTAQSILEAGEHLLGVINDILDFSRLEAGKVVIENAPFRLAGSVNRSLDLVRERAHAKQLHLNCHLAETLPEWVEGDAMRLEQILLNLLANAVKFTDRGEICLSVETANDGIVFRVRDSGIGMNQDQLARLFQPFEQADSSTTRRFGGSGLGLRISQGLAHQMGGEVSASSREGEGSEFVLSLPLPACEPPMLQPDQPTRSTSAGGSRLRGLRVLAAEDVEFNRVVLEDLLLHHGAEVSFAEHGAEVLNILAEHGEAAFDVLLTDIQMPVMDGYELAHRVRDTYPGLPVIGLTAHALSEERDRCLAAGMLAHVTKPINEDTLIDTLLRHARRAPTQTHLPDPSVLDWTALLDRYKGRQAFAERLIGMFLGAHGDTARRLQAALEHEDRAQAVHIVHTLKSTAGSIEAGALSRAAAQAEESLQAGSSSGFTALRVVIAELEALVSALRTWQQERAAP